MNGRTPPNFLNILDEHFNNADLRELAREIGTDYENLAGDTRRGRILSLIEYVEQRKQVDELWALVVAKRPFLHQEGEAKKMTKISIEIIKWASVILGLIAAVITIALWLSDKNDDQILLTVQVNSSEDQLAILNAKVTVELPNELISPERTDENGRAVFYLEPETNGSLARVTVEHNSQVKTQNVLVKVGMGGVEFQIEP